MIVRSWNIPPGAMHAEFTAKIVKFLGAVSQGPHGIAVMAEVDEEPRAGSRLILPKEARIAPKSDGNKVIVQVLMDEMHVPAPYRVRMKANPAQEGLAQWHFLGGVPAGEGVLFVYAFVVPGGNDPVELVPQDG